MTRAIYYRLSLLVLLAIGCGSVRAEAEARPAIPAATVEIAKTIPIQDGGRVKPLDTFARFKMLKLHGKRRMRLASESGRVTIEPTEWLLHCLFYPEAAKAYPTFTIDNQETLIAIGVTPHGKKRDRYSYAELLPGRDRLIELGQQYEAVDEKVRTLRQRMIANLAANVIDFEYLIHHLDLARDPFFLPAGPSPDAEPDADAALEKLSLSAMLTQLPVLREKLLKEDPELKNSDPETLAALSDALQRLHFYMGVSSALHLFPPTDPATEEWRAAGELVQNVLHGDAQREADLARLRELEELAAARDDPGAFAEKLTALRASLLELAAARGEGNKIAGEVAFYKVNYFFWSLFGYLVCFLAIALSWLAPSTPDGQTGMVRRLGRALLLYLPLVASTLVLCVGIAVRCWIRGRPPVTNLYETILFVTAVAVIVAMVLEWMNRDRIALAMAPVLGALGMFLALKYEMKEAVDTMPSLVAVLNTNFWLSTHVTCITIGYGAGLLGAALAHLYIMGKLLGLGRKRPDFYRNVVRMVYGVICFTLLFSFVGTMLGGIWANYSWGRFWGWDPKENGALMICLWNLIILHARLGGYIRDFGLCACAIVGGMIVAFSWWGVNLLGVGLHSYGFTSGIMGWLVIFWLAETALLGVGMLRWALSRK